MALARYAVVQGGSTTINVTLWDGVTPYTPPAGCALVPEGSAPAYAPTPSAPEAKANPYGYVAPLTGATVTMAAAQDRLVIDPAGTLAALTVQLPPSPVEGQLASFSTTKALTVLTVQGQSGASVAGAVLTLPIGGVLGFIYRTSSKTWYPGF
jgi:hypothetical protein